MTCDTLPNEHALLADFCDELFQKIQILCCTLYMQMLICNAKV